MAAALALLAAALGGCSGGVPGAGKAAEPPPLNPTQFPAQYKSEVADFVRRFLNNPTKVKDAYIGQPALKPVNGQPQYITCVRYNPRDASNRYTGTESRLAIFLGGRLNQFLPGNPEMCGGLTYQRYPEIENLVP
jgi:hypothetical protein